MSAELKQRRARYSAALRDADQWLDLARQQAKKRDYKRSRDAMLSACFALDAAASFDVLAEQVTA